MLGVFYMINLKKTGFWLGSCEYAQGDLTSQQLDHIAIRIAGKCQNG